MGVFGGEVTDPKMFTRSLAITKKGLLSEQIFGPIKSYCCPCGTFSDNTKSIDEGKICPKCGVKCISNESRLTTFGKITLVFPVIKPTKMKYFKKIVSQAEKHLLDPQKADVSSSLAKYLAISPNGFAKLDCNCFIRFLSAGR